MHRSWSAVGTVISLLCPSVVSCLLLLSGFAGRLDKTSHSIFFTTCTNKVLQDKAEDIFQEWAQSSLEYPSVKITPSDHDASDIDLACLYSIDALMNGTQKRTDPTEILDNNQDQNFNLNAQSAMTPREKRLRKRNIREAQKETENVSQEQGTTVGQDSTTSVADVVCTRICKRWGWCVCTIVG